MLSLCAVPRLLALVMCFTDLTVNPFPAGGQCLVLHSPYPGWFCGSDPSMTLGETGQAQTPEVSHSPDGLISYGKNSSLDFQKIHLTLRTNGTSSTSFRWYLIAPHFYVWPFCILNFKVLKLASAYTFIEPHSKDAAFPKFQWIDWVLVGPLSKRLHGGWGGESRSRWIFVSLKEA